MTNIGINIGLEGLYTVTKHKANGTIVDRWDFKNIVLDVGWQELRSRFDVNYVSVGPEYLYLGTGTTEPLSSDTGLENLSATLGAKHRSSVSFGGGTNPRYSRATYAFSYGEGEAEGVWTELGLAFDNTYTKPYNRSLIRDAQGNPDSITVLSDEFLNVWVELRIYINVANESNIASGTFDYNGTSIGWTASLHPSAWIGSYQNLWFQGFRGMRLYYQPNSAAGPIQPSFSKIGDLSFQTSLFSRNPSAAYDFTKCVIESRNGSSAWDYGDLIIITFDQNIQVPATHKITVQPASLSFERAGVPQ